VLTDAIAYLAIDGPKETLTVLTFFSINAIVPYIG
jgi:hypothetical protein